MNKIWTRSLIFMCVGLLMGMAACQDRSVREGGSSLPRGTESEPRKVRVQHILIGFQGSLPGDRATRSKREAEKLAEELFEKARARPSDFPDLVRAHSDDQAPGVYHLTNFGVKAEGNEFPRGQMVPAFGNVGFKLKVGEIGLARHNSVTSPYGYHIIMRLPD